MEYFSNITKLIENRSLGIAKYNFNSSIPLTEIETFEKAFGLVLSDAYKQFLHVCNGGMILEYEPAYYTDMTDWEPDGPKESSYYCYTVTELLHAYQDAKFDKYLLTDTLYTIYPIVPICRTPKGDLIFIVNEKGLNQASPVFYCQHNDGDYTCYQIATDFNAFLGLYLKTEGFPSLVHDSTALSWQEFLKKTRLLELAQKEETESEIISRSTAYLDLFPDDAWTYCKRGNAYLYSKKIKKAFSDFNKAIDLDGKEGFFYHCRGDLILDYGKPRNALVDMDIAVTLEPDNLLFLTGRADAFLKLKQLKRALTDCNKVLAVDQNYELGLLTRIKVYNALGELEKAQADSDLLDLLYEK